MNWYFPKNDGGQFHGIGDSGIDLFKGDPVKSLTREICQNSIDAGLREDAPVKIEFELFSVPTSKLPGYLNLKKNFEMAQAFCKQQQFAKATKYFEKSLPILQSDTIDVLRISDFNTSGLPGATTADTDFTSPWFRLVRSVGSSDKADGSIGAFGSGKMAAFGCSDLQTVFYNTLVEGEGEAYQGVSKLIGFIDEEGHQRSDIGYFCEDKSMPIFDQLKLQEGFDRNTSGTDVYILGFKFGGIDWKKGLIASVLDGFFYAIAKEHLVVEVDGIVINSKTLPKLMGQYQDNIDKKTVDYYKLMTSDCEVRKFTCMEDGDVEVIMQIAAGFSKRVAIIRYPGMKVFDKGSISATIPFAGICVIKGKKLSMLLGGLENIQHNKWELSRYDDDPVKQKEAKKERDKLYRYLQESFKELRGQDTEGEMDPNVGDCLPDPISDTEDQKQMLTDEILEVGKERKAVVKAIEDVYLEDEEGENIESGDSPQGTSGGPRNQGDELGGSVGVEPGPGPGLEPGNNPPEEDVLGSVAKVKYVHANIRFRPIDVKTGDYIISVVPQKDIVNGRLDIFMVAETSRYEAKVVSANIDGESLLVNENRVEEINLSQGIETIIRIKLDYSDICTLEVMAYGY